MRTHSNQIVLVCMNHRANPNQPSCGARNSKEIFTALSDSNLNILIKESPCMGLCDVGPNVRLVPNSVSFQHVSKSNLNQIIEEMKALINC